MGRRVSARAIVMHEGKLLCARLKSPRAEGGGSIRPYAVL